MGVMWLAPEVWWLGTLVALPIAAHLLARHRRRPLRFPTLRFLDEAAAPSRRRWYLREPGLLAVRMAIVVAVAAALAGPLLVTAARQARWDTPVAQAVVLTPDVATSTAADPSAGEGAVRRFVTADVRAGLADAAAWLEGHGLSRREIVVMGPLMRDALTAVDVQAVPADIGVRFVRAGVPPAAATERVRVQLIDGTLWRITEVVTLDAAGTTVRETGRVAEASRVFETTAPPAERDAAEAARRAVLRRGVVLASADTALITVPWSGAIAELAAAVDAQSGAALAGHDPTPIEDAALAAMTRPPSLHGPSAPVDQGDRRLLWLAVLTLLGLEVWLRRRPA